MQELKPQFKPLKLSEKQKVVLMNLNPAIKPHHIGLKPSGLRRVLYDSYARNTRSFKSRPIAGDDFKRVKRGNSWFSITKGTVTRIDKH